jgi:hypothetical protein
MSAIMHKVPLPPTNNMKIKCLGERETVTGHTVCIFFVLFNDAVGYYDYAASIVNE